ncbi:MAG: LytTR family transcriptional regulator DNA-binding domain-containing protein [Bacteroidales bacterium]
MLDFQKPLPPYLYEKGNIVRLILFTAIFALVFINIYSPFGVEKWYSVTNLELFFYSSLVTLTGVLIVVISRIVMYYFCRKQLISLWQYLVWVFFEIMLMALFYAIFEKFILNDTREFDGIMKLSARNTALVILLPYSVSWLYFSWRDKKEQIERLADSQTFPDNSRDMIPFYDEKSVLKFSVKKENLLYIESTENYVSICYLNKDKLSKYLLRNTMKRMEEAFAGTEIIRCHRSYMVNFEKVKVIRKDKDGLKLELDEPSIMDIPVTKTFAENVMATFSKYSHLTDKGQ